MSESHWGHDGANCNNCRFFAYPDCRRHAPIAIEARDGFAGKASWPHVTHFDWCGDFERVAEKEKP